MVDSAVPTVNIVVSVDVPQNIQPIAQDSTDNAITLLGIDAIGIPLRFGMIKTLHGLCTSTVVQ